MRPGLVGLTILAGVSLCMAVNPYAIINAEDYSDNFGDGSGYHPCDDGSQVFYYINGNSNVSYLYNNLQFNSSKAELIQLSLVGLGSGYVDLSIGTASEFTQLTSFPIQKTEEQGCNFLNYYSVFLQSQPTGTTQNLLMSFRSTNGTEDFVYINNFQFFATVSPDPVQ